jgi:membrane-associated phospholipid phosphatase
MPPSDTDRFWLAVSLVGSPVAMAILCVVLTLVLLRFGNRRAALASAVIASVGGLLNTALKELVHRPRPPGAERFLFGHSWSFPSGHAMGSLIGFGMLGYCALTYTSLRTSARQLIVGVCAILTILIGFSRVALGVHYRGDVLGGWIIGGVWLAAGIALLRTAERRAAIAYTATVTPEQ